MGLPKGKDTARDLTKEPLKPNLPEIENEEQRMYHIFVGHIISAVARKTDAKDKANLGCQLLPSKR